MASPEWNKIDNFKENFEERYCVFLDILGYKEKAKLYFDNQLNLVARIERALEQVDFNIKVMRQSGILSVFTIEIFSDSIIMYSPKKEKNGLWTLLLISCNLVAYLSYEELFVRGGISVGKHKRKTMKYDLDFLASEALQKAYNLESKHAIFPRILIDPDIISNLDNDTLRLIIGNKLIIRNEDDYILHFSIFIANKDGGNSKDLFAEMKDIESLMNSVSNEEVKEKYQWLLDYYYWTITEFGSMDASPFKCFSSGKNRSFSSITF